MQSRGEDGERFVRRVMTNARIDVVEVPAMGTSHKHYTTWQFPNFDEPLGSEQGGLVHVS